MRSDRLAERIKVGQFNAAVRRAHRGVVHAMDAAMDDPMYEALGLDSTMLSVRVDPLLDENARAGFAPDECELAAVVEFLGDEAEEVRLPACLSWREMGRRVFHHLLAAMECERPGEAAGRPSAEYGWRDERRESRDPVRPGRRG